MRSLFTRINSFSPMAALAVAGVIGCAGMTEAQTPRHATYMGADWGYFLYENGGAVLTIVSGQPGLHWGQPDAVITIVSRNGRALARADQAYASEVAQALCEQTGRRFNTRTQGQWLNTGGLSFNGACSQW